MIKTIFIINGMGSCGKDFLINSLPEQDKIYNISSIDCIKTNAKPFGYHGGKSPRDRKFLSELKRITTEYNDYSFGECMSEVSYFLNDPKLKLMFLHIREPEEIRKVVDCIHSSEYLFLSTQINVVTLLVKDIESETHWGNNSDDNVENYKYDLVFENNKSETECSIENFKSKIFEISEGIVSVLG